MKNKGYKMKHTNGAGTFTTNQMSIDETIQEAMDVVNIAIAVLNNDADIPQALTNLNAAQTYLEHIRKKSKIALAHVPAEIQTQEYL